MFELALIPGALLAGVLMFLAPCTLPIVPGYLAFIAGGSGKVMRNALAFVLGFSTVFIILGLFAGLVGALIGEWRGVLSQAAGFLLILFGLTMLGVRIPLLSAEKHLSFTSFKVGRMLSSYFIGALFAFGWSPCVGPILGTVLLLASQSTTVLEGVFLLLLFSVGLAVPFLLTAYFIESAGNAFVKWGNFTSAFNTFGAVMLILTGALILFGYMGVFVNWALSAFKDFYEVLLPYM